MRLEELRGWKYHRDKFYRERDDQHCAICERRLVLIHWNVYRSMDEEDPYYQLCRYCFAKWKKQNVGVLVARELMKP